MVNLHYHITCLHSPKPSQLFYLKLHQWLSFVYIPECLDIDGSCEKGNEMALNNIKGRRKH